MGDVTDAAVAAVVTGAPGPATARLAATTDFEALGSADAVVLCVPTPLRESKDPDISHVVHAAQQACARARAGQLIVLESTTYPGTTEELRRPRSCAPAASSPRTGGRPRLLSGARRMPRQPHWTLRNTPKVVGGTTPACTAAAAALYARICERIVPLSSPAAAETVKVHGAIERAA